MVRRAEDAIGDAKSLAIRIRASFGSLFAELLRDAQYPTAGRRVCELIAKRIPAPCVCVDGRHLIKRAHLAASVLRCLPVLTAHATAEELHVVFRFGQLLQRPRNALPFAVTCQNIRPRPYRRTEVTARAGHNRIVARGSERPTASRRGGWTRWAKPGGRWDTLPSALRRTARGAGCLSCQRITTRSAFVVRGAIALSEHDALQSEA